MNFWLDLLSNVIAVIICAILTLMIGFHLLVREQKENKRENRNRYIESINKELEQHNNLLDEHPISILHRMGPGSEYIRYYSTVAFNSGTHSGLFSYLSKNVQRKMADHYTKVYIINDLLKIHASEYLKNQRESKFRLSEISRHESFLKKSIKNLQKQLEFEIQVKQSDCD